MQDDATEGYKREGKADGEEKEVIRNYTKKYIKYI